MHFNNNFSLLFSCYIFHGRFADSHFSRVDSQTFAKMRQMDTPVNIRNIKEVKLKDFQFKINNHILVTKSFLFKINKTDNDRCSLCNREVEIIIHLFFHCSKVKEFWSALHNWLQVQANIAFDLKIVLFSKQPEHKLLNHLLLLARYFIYKNIFFTNYFRL